VELFYEGIQQIIRIVSYLISEQSALFIVELSSHIVKIPYGKVVWRAAAIVHQIN
jgi:hypothetical protein